MLSFTEFGRYQLLGRIATGGMAEIWAAQLLGASDFRKPLAIKRVLPHLARDPLFLRMLLTEARVGAQLSHPNVCTVFELGEVAGEYYIAMEYLRGGSLVHLLRDHGALPPDVAAAIVAQACEGLHHAHEHRGQGGTPLGLVHRDISPPNLFVTVDGIVKVLDFGIAKVDDGSSEPTDAGKVKGKLAYMSPEQLGGKPVDRRSDVWSLGIVLWELLTGRRLFGGGPGAAVDAIRAARVPTLASRGIDLPAVDAVIARSICAHESRYATAAALRRALLEALPLAPAPLEAIAETVMERCGEKVHEQDRLLDDADDLDIIARLPLRATPHPEVGGDDEPDASDSLDALLAELKPSWPRLPALNHPSAPPELPRLARGRPGRAVGTPPGDASTLAWDE